MANVAIFKVGQIPQYLISINTPDYSSDPDVIVNPDISTVSSVLLKYWKRSGNSILEMDATEKQAVDDAELLLKKNAVDNFGVELLPFITALIKVINLRLPSNKITKQEVIDAVKLEIV